MNGPEPDQASLHRAALSRDARAASGLVLVLFLVLHLAAVALAPLAPARFEALATWLHGLVWLSVLEVALALLLLLHPALALAKTLALRGVRGPVAAPLRSRRGGGVEALAAAAGRGLPWSGAVLLLFLPVHLAQLRWSRPAAGAELPALRQALASPWSLLLYAAAGVALVLHLLHGTESAHRSLGLLEPGHAGPIRRAGRALALLLGGGFVLVPLALRLGSGG